MTRFCNQVKAMVVEFQIDNTWFWFIDNEKLRRKSVRTQWVNQHLDKYSLLFKKYNERKVSFITFTALLAHIKRGNLRKKDNGAGREGEKEATKNNWWGEKREEKEERGATHNMRAHNESSVLLYFRIDFSK